MEEEILKLFLYNEKLKFSSMEKILKVRSNKLSYHLLALIKNNILEKEGNQYKLSQNSEFRIPYMSDKKSPLPVILVYIGDGKSCFLINRDKKPFKGKLGLPGGRILLGESIEESVVRIMKSKFNIKAKLKQIHSISLEQVKTEDKLVHSFLIILVSATSKDKIKLTNISENQSKIISSDYKIIKKELKNKIKISKITTKNK